MDPCREEMYEERLDMIACIVSIANLGDRQHRDRRHKSRLLKQNAESMGIYESTGAEGFGIG